MRTNTYFTINVLACYKRCGKGCGSLWGGFAQGQAVILPEGRLWKGWFSILILPRGSGPLLRAGAVPLGSGSPGGLSDRPQGSLRQPR